MKELYLVDGNSLLFRAYYATAFPGAPIMKTKDGTPTNAIFAFTNMMNKILALLPQGSGLVVAFDTGHKTFRHEQFEEYKAQRKPGPEELFIQMPIARDLLKALNILTTEVIGYEGDDIVGTLAKHGCQADIAVKIFTSDRDFLQLVNDCISVHILKKGFQDIKVYNHQEVVEEYGILPQQMVDYKALIGDPSDNYKGIPGIGPKKAQQLLNEYGTFENIVSHADTIGGKVGALLKEHLKEGETCKMLATIHCEVPLDFALEDTLYAGYEFETAANFLRRYEIISLISRLNPTYRLNDQVVTEAAPVKRISTFQDFNYQIPFAIVPILGDAKANYHHNNLQGLVLCNGQELAIISLTDLKNDPLGHQVIEADNIRKICLNSKELVYLLLQNGLHLQGVSFDLLLAAYLLDSGSNPTVSTLFNLFDEFYEPQDNLETNALNIGALLLKCYKLAQQKLQENHLNHLFETVELPLSDILARMEFAGFPLDRTTLENFGEEYRSKLETLSTQIYDLAQEKFNIASPKQVGDILYDKLQLKSNRKRSTSSDYLKMMRQDHPIVPLILEYRKYAKLLSQYVESLSEHIQADGKIHTIFNQALTTTGRLSSQEPNMQNITIREAEGRKVRQAFFYPDDKLQILALDYSHIELCILASASRCPGLIQAFNDHRDIHTETAKKVFHSDNPTPEQRRQAKAVSFGIVYGISDWGLSEQLEIPVEESKMIITEFYEAYPEIKEYLDTLAQLAQEKGYAETIYGRRRYLRELYDANYMVREGAKRAALNAPIQGSAADIIKMAMIAVDTLLKEKNLKTKMVLQIHDELVFEVPQEEIEVVPNLIKEAMENVVNLDVKLEVGGGLGHTWFEAK